MCLLNLLDLRVAGSQHRWDYAFTCCGVPEAPSKLAPVGSAIDAFEEERPISLLHIAFMPASVKHSHFGLASSDVVLRCPMSNSSNPSLVDFIVTVFGSSVHLAKTSLNTMREIVKTVLTDVFGPPHFVIAFDKSLSCSFVRGTLLSDLYTFSW